MLATLEGYEDTLLGRSRFKKIAKKAVKNKYIRAAVAPTPQTYAALLGKFKLKKLAKKAAGKSLKLTSKITSNPLVKTGLSFVPGGTAALTALDVAKTLVPAAKSVRESAGSSDEIANSLVEQSSTKSESVQAASQNLNAPKEDLLRLAKTPQERSDISDMKDKYETAVNVKQKEIVKDVIAQKTTNANIANSPAERYYRAGLL
jgi:hypothetical protein